MLLNYVRTNFFIKRIFKRMRFFLFLFLSLCIESNITERDDVKEFIKFAISNSDLDRDEVLAFIKDAKPSKKAVVLKNNQPEVKATWDSYRNTRVSATRVINGLKFLLDHKILLENVEKDFGVSKFYIAVSYTHLTLPTKQAV